MSRTIARGFGAAAALAALVALSACSGTAGGDGVASAGGQTDRTNEAGTEDAALLDDDDQALVFAECMRDNGVEMPDPGPGQQGLMDAFDAVSGDYDQATLQQAFTACQDLMPSFAQEEAHDEEDMLAFAECLREEGLDVSDEPFADIHGGAVDQDDFVAAMEVCREILTGGAP